MGAQVRHSHLHVVPNGVDFNLFKPFSKREQRKERRGERRRILFLGNPADPRKNFALAQTACEIIKGRGKSIALVNPFGVSQTEIVKHMNSCDVLLLTSLQEGSPNVIKEAMACNLPIVATDVGDVREVLGDTKGCYVTSFAPFDIANCITDALEFRGGTRGREKITHLDINTVAKRIISIYEGLRQT
jgi:glycosyltransferase involved in cell wall biosynthesis